MTDREKLIELISKGHDYFYSEEFHGFNVYEAIATYLLANGVVVQKHGCAKTNADRIRSMTDEELAWLLIDSCRGSTCEDQAENEYGSINCRECRLQ